MARKRKPEKPEWPPPHITMMTAHPCGQWVKKINGRVCYFGSWADPDAALEKFHRDAPYLYRGEEPPPEGEDQQLNLDLLVNAFLTAKQQQRDLGRLAHRTYAGYVEAGQIIIDTIGRHRNPASLGPADFAKLKAAVDHHGVDWRGTLIRMMRTCFKWSYDQGLVETMPRYGALKPPAKVEYRRARAQRPSQIYTAEEVRKLIKVVKGQMRAMILLGINAGLGNSDCARLPVDLIDFKQGLIDYSRWKSGEARQVTLWPETAQALREVVADPRIQARREAAGDLDKGLVFLTAKGNRWVREYVREDENGKEHTVSDNAVSKEFSKLMKKAGVRPGKGKGKGRGFYSLRHTFRTIAGEVGDIEATFRLMGHDLPGMAEVYVGHIGADRLRRITNHVRAWLQPERVIKVKRSA